jgi:hypothetical protein
MTERDLHHPIFFKKSGEFYGKNAKKKTDTNKSRWKFCLKDHRPVNGGSFVNSSSLPNDYIMQTSEWLYNKSLQVG